MGKRLQRKLRTFHYSKGVGDDRYGRSRKQVQLLAPNTSNSAKRKIVEQGSKDTIKDYSSVGMGLRIKRTQNTQIAEVGQTHIIKDNNQRNRARPSFAP